MSTENTQSTFKNLLHNLNFPFSIFHDKETLTHISQICTSKLTEIDTKTKELLNEDENKKSNKMLFIVKSFKEEEEKRKRLSLSSLSNQRKSVNNDYLLLKLNKLPQKNFKDTLNVSNYLNKSNRILIKNKTTPYFYSGKQIEKSKSGSSIFMTHLLNNKLTGTPKSESGTINSPSPSSSQLRLKHLSSPNQINKPQMSCRNNSLSSPKSLRPLNHSNLYQTLTSPIIAKYHYILDTLAKSMKEHDRFNRNLNFYMKNQRKNRVSKSFPKKGKTKRELELEGKYEELTEKMRFTSSSFKEQYISYKNKRTGNYHIIRSGYADLMNYIDNYSKMEDCLFFRYKDRVSKMYPVIQEAADIRVVPNENDIFKTNNSNNNKRDQKDEKTFNEKEISPKTRKIRNLAFSLQMKKNRLMNRLNEDIKQNDKDLNIQK